MKTWGVRFVLCTAGFALTASAQLVGWGDSLPKRDKPPIVFVTGHDSICPDPRSGELPFFNLTFGDFDKVVARDGRVSLVFEACYAPNRPPIEQLANRLRDLLSLLKYETGEPVREIDMIAHSMGGLVVRSYLAGKQVDGTFNPPVEPRVRKVVFIGTPHFGTNVAAVTDNDAQLREMSFGSQFLFDLATWNQGTDDFRGVEALAIVGTAGRNGVATDSVVAVSSASMGFSTLGRSVLLPYCHTQGGIGQLFLCAGAPGLARVTNDDHPSARLVLSFLNETEYWRTAADTAAIDAVLAHNAGLFVQMRTADDVSRPIESAGLSYDTGDVRKLGVSSAGIAFGEGLPSGMATVTVDGVRRRVQLPVGGSRAFVIKQGLFIEQVEPAAAGPSWPLALAPGMLVSIKGTSMNVGPMELYVSGKAVPVLSATDTHVLAVLPEDALGAVELGLRNVAGQHTTRIFLESSRPSLFIRDGLPAIVDASSGELVSERRPARAGSVISIFLTGLGRTEVSGVLAHAVQQPVVRVEGQLCEILYAGRAPAMPGVDQINCRLPQNIGPGTSRIIISSGMRSGTGTVYLQ